MQSAIQRNTGLTITQFNDLVDKLPTLHSVFSNQLHVKSAVYMYLMKMRTGLPSADIGNTFHVSRVTVERQLAKVRKAMDKDFVYEYVNYKRSREELLQLNSVMGQNLFCNDDTGRIALICDGTYIYINKSRNYEFQKNTYNDQKKRNFVKIMMVVSGDGEIVYALGPYPAVDNDAKILKTIFEETDAFEILQNNDVLILDRGFRDCIGFLQDKGIDVKMPHLIQKTNKKRQLPTIDANQSRLVTAVRFVVECRNGHLKTIFKIFDSTWNSQALPHLKDDIQICSAIINCYFRKIESNQGYADRMSQQMLDKLDKPNELSRITEMQAFQNQMKNAELFEIFDNLPSLTEEHLLFISFGPYQIKQAHSYCQEHMKAHQNRFEIFSLPENTMHEFFNMFYDNYQNLVLLYCSFKSRFVSGKKHRTYVLIDVDGIDERAVVEYCCSCYSGLRTVGCCSHIMCIIWFTLHIKNNNTPKPAAFLDQYFETE